MVNVNKALAAAIVGISLFGAVPASAATTFTNTWDSVDFGSGPGYIILPAYEGWTAVAGGIEIQYNNVAGAPYSGENFVELDANFNSTMERLIDAGAYTLSFYYSARPGIPSSSNGIDVLLNGLSIYNVTGAGTGSTNWMLNTVNFSLAAPGSLRFAAIGTSDSLGGYLENVSLAAAVPEPATWAMMLIGFGVVGFGMRRRKALQLTPQAG